MKKLIASAAVLALAGTAAADTMSQVLNIEWPGSTPGGSTVATGTISLPAVASIDSITLELAHTWGGDFDVSVDAPGGGTFDYDLMFFEPSSPGTSGDFSMGVAVENGALSNVASYTFIESGGLTGWTGPHSASGTYDANAWLAGPNAAGDYNLTIVDLAGGDGGAIGTWTIEYTLIPAPGAFALLGLAGVASRRRRRTA